MHTIIGLRGKGNSGKSSTIRILHQLLRQHGYNLIRTTFRIDGGDFISIFSNGNNLIGITSSGDTYDLVHEKLQELVDEACNIIICACRTFDRIPPGTNAAILEFTNYRNQFVEKTIDENPLTQPVTNDGDAQILFSRIKNMI
jgi:hypothetical protein